MAENKKSFRCKNEFYILTKNNIDLGMNHENDIIFGVTIFCLVNLSAKLEKHINTTFFTGLSICRYLIRLISCSNEIYCSVILCTRINQFRNLFIPNWIL